MFHFLVFLLPALFAVVAMKVIFKREITTREFFIHLGSSLGITVVIYAISFAFLYSSMADTQILNGMITNKFKHTEICSEYSSCENYYIKTKTKTRINSKGKLERYTETYKVFLYSTEFDWYLQTSTDDNIKIKRVNDRGDVMPPRWNMAHVGDYSASTSIYINPLLSGDVSLFNTAADSGLYSDEDLKDIPDYPEVYDYYRFNPVINLTQHDVSFIRTELNKQMRTMGASKQANVIFVVIDSNINGDDFTKKLKQKWNGGKKNDIIIVVGIDKIKNITFLTSNSYADGSGNELLHSTLKMRYIANESVLDLNEVRVIMSIIDDKFNRLPASEFNYMLTDVKPSFMLIIIIIILTLGVGYILVNNRERN